MKIRSIVISFVLGFLTMAMSLLPAQANELAGITVQGSATVRVAPDMATFNFSIVERGASLARLKRSVDDRSAELINLSLQLGVARTDVTSAEVRIRPRYDHPNANLIGYDVSREVLVVLKDLERYTDLVNGAIDAGISSLGNIQLDVSNRRSLEINSLAAAMAAARRKAEIIAVEADVSLGKVISVREAGAFAEAPLYQVRAESMAMGSPAAFEPGEIMVSSQVNVTFAID